MGEILFLAHRVPFPPNRGDKIRAHFLLKRLAQIAPVHVGCFSETDEDRRAIAEVKAISKSHCVVDRKKPLALAGAQALVSGKPVSLTAFHSQYLERFVERALAVHPIDTIVVFSGQMGQYVPDAFGGKVVIDLCDVDSAKFESYAANGERVWVNRREARLLSAEEQRLANRADDTILISESEAELFRRRLSAPNAAHLTAIGNGIDARYFDPGAVASHPDFDGHPGPHFVFTGQMDYRPNEQATLWVIDEVMPRVRARFPQAKFHVVGRNPTAALSAKHGINGTEIWGEVPDVRPFVRGADAVLAPLQIARGVQNKVLEAMAMARAVVLTQEAATGIDGRDGQHWLIGPSEAEVFAVTLVELIGDPAKRRQLGEEARKFVLERHDWQSVLGPFERILRDRPEVRDAA